MADGSIRVPLIASVTGARRGLALTLADADDARWFEPGDLVSGISPTSCLRSGFAAVAEVHLGTGVVVVRGGIAGLCAGDGLVFGAAAP